MTSEFTLLQCEHPCGVSSGPAEHYKRAVLRPPPAKFTVEFLPVQKSGSHHHGMRISPALCDRDSFVSRSTVEYDIWRKWEDILWFQDNLEREYRQAAREKKTRLAQGKGVKSFNGMYKQDMASSWESLPPGPDPNSVSQDIHTYLPRLTKKGTLFRASQSTIEQRQKEIQNLVESLLSPSMPALIQEIRESSHVKDFFGLWRRDFDLLEKAPKSHRTSVTSSVFSLYFSDASTLTIPTSPPSNPSSLPNSPTRKSTSRRPRSSGSACSDITEETSSASIITPRSVKRLSDSSDDGSTLRIGSILQRTRSRALSSASSDSSSVHSDGSTNSITTKSNIPAIVDQNSLTFDPNAHDPAERPSSILEVLPEEREMLAKSPEGYLTTPPRRIRTTSSEDRKSHRTWTVYGTPPTKPAELSQTDDHSVRESWQTTSTITAGANDFLEGLGLSFPDSRDRTFRASVSSISTFMTTDSAEAVLPREPTTPITPHGRHSRPPRISTAITLSDFDMYSDIDEEDANSLLDAFPRPRTSMDYRPETPIRRSGNSLSVPTTPITPHSAPSTKTSFDRPSSPTASVISSVLTVMTTSTTPSSSSTSLSIKAAHNDSIIMLKVAWDLPFEDIRHRIYSKFVGQEGLPLSKDFAIALAVPSTTSDSPSKTPNTKCTRSLSAGAEKMELHFIDSQFDWEQIVLIKECNKVSLRILDAPKSQS
ncbi:hypothetical protein CPB83DRAFT_860634 [Crepidotus variabilis]|uniref:PX domain-containing protein n=1 Tax=Crepidotus variabilis TaxID=179855 RepID=A0A9P6E8V9_9AGAR|nr:hypothetical protein CPB83DRAFT_860634 [Crepidotus variabilis]